jgi:hypothetical protein
MLHTLTRHPDSVCESVTRIDVEAMRRAACVTLRYRIQGNIAAVRMPAIATGRADELWQHTCCELFIKPQGAAYTEFNLSPSTQWAAYRFSGYRADRVDASVADPIITVMADTGCFELQAVIDCNSLSLPNDLWYIGLSVVIEETSGRKSYWALAHAPGKPDFHHATGFAVALER